MVRKKFYSPNSGEWQRPIRRGYRLACCDCSLVHRVDFQIVKDIPKNKRRCDIIKDKRLHIEFRVYRDEPSTTYQRGLGHIIICSRKKSKRVVLR